MSRKLYASVCSIVFVGLFIAQPAFAETPNEILDGLSKEAANTNGFQGFSAVRGERFFKSKQGNEWSCSSCHTDNPAAPGKHAKTGKTIQALAPSANAERFTNPKKVDKWFKRNCNDVLGRICTAQEKGDVLTYLLAIKN